MRHYAGRLSGIYIAGVKAGTALLQEKWTRILTLTFTRSQWKIARAHHHLLVMSAALDRRRRWNVRWSITRGKWSVVKASLCHLVCLSGCDANDSPDLNAEIGARCKRNSLVEQASMILFESGHSYVVERKLVFRKTLLLCSAIVAISFQL